MTEKEIKKLAENDRLLCDILDIPLYRKLNQYCENCRCADQIMDFLDRKVEKLAA